VTDFEVAVLLAIGLLVSSLLLGRVGRFGSKHESAEFVAAEKKMEAKGRVLFRWVAALVALYAVVSWGIVRLT
jgi:hypothetical protein